MVTKFVVQNNVPDTKGGKKFNQELGADKMRKVLQDAANYIHGALDLSKPKAIATVTLTIASFDGVAQKTGESEIQLSSDYVANSQPKDSLVKEITGVLYHESTQVWQNNNGDYGNDKFFRGAIEGVADWIRLKAGFAAAGWPARSRGGNWYDQSYTTAYFFDWIETKHKPKFVNLLNQKMALPWSNDFFQHIVGKDVDALWVEYQNSIV